MTTYCARLLVSLAAVLAVGACGGGTGERIPVIQPSSGASPDGITTLDPQAAPLPATPSPSAIPAAPAAVASAAKVTGGTGLPVSVDIPAIGVHSTHLPALGLNKDGSVSTPSLKTPQVVGYYALSSPPCVSGPDKVPFALISHIDGSGQRGGFADLKNLKAGDTVTVRLDTGKSCIYRITRLDKYDKNSVPADKVWGPTQAGEIRLISCGGPFIGGKLGYADNLVGTGVLVG